MINPVIPITFVISMLVTLLGIFYKWRNPKGIYFKTVSKFNKDIQRFKKSHFKGVQSFIRYDSEDYINRESNNKVKDFLISEDTSDDLLVKGKSMMGKTSMVYNEIIKNRDTIKRWRVFIPESESSLSGWHRKLPLWIRPKNYILIIDDLHRFLPLGKTNLSEVINKLSKRGQLKVIATCRCGYEWKSVESEFGDFFNKSIELEKISEKEAEKLAASTNKEMINFDGSPGSIILGITRQKEKIDNFEKDGNNCYDILRSAAVLYYFLWFKIYKIKEIKSIARYIFENNTIETKFGENLDQLLGNGLVSAIEGADLIIADPYLDYIKGKLTTDLEGILAKIESYIKRKISDKDFIERFARFYTFLLGAPLMKLGKHNEAIEAYNKALKIKPDDHEAWYNKGVALAKLGKHNEAIEAFDEALKIKPDLHQAWYNKGTALAKLGKHNEAIEAYDEALKLNPDFYQGWYNKGLALRKLGKNNEANECFKKRMKSKTKKASNNQI